MAQVSLLLLFPRWMATRSVSGLVFSAGICIRHAAAVNHVLISIKPFTGFDQTVREKVLREGVTTRHPEPSVSRNGFRVGHDNGFAITFRRQAFEPERHGTRHTV
jgi:hypothetical protein